MQKHLLQRSPTQVHKDSANLNVKVISFLCDQKKDTVKRLTHKIMTWQLMIGGEATEWNLTIDETITSKDQKVTFTTKPLDGAKTQPLFDGHLKDDYKFHQPIKGCLKNLNVADAYEVTSMGSDGSWNRATLTVARPDGKYEALVMMPDMERPGFFKPVPFPIVEAKNIRDSITKEPVSVPTIDVQLIVPKADCFKPQLTIDNGPFENYFAAPTPKDLWDKTKYPKKQMEIKLTVNKERTMVSSVGCGHGKLKAFTEDKVYVAPGGHLDKTKCVWCIQIGPFAKHEIVLQATTKTGGMNLGFSHATGECTLLIDGKVICEGDVKDVFGGGDVWTVEVALEGKNAILCDCFEEVSGVATDKLRENLSCRSKAVTHTVSVTAKDPKNLKTAVCMVDEVDVHSLPQWKDLLPEPDLGTMADNVETIEMTHNIRIPHAVSGTGGGLMDDFGGVISDVFGADAPRSLMQMLSFCSCTGAGAAVAGDGTQMIVGNGPEGGAQSSGGAQVNPTPAASS